MADMFTGTIAPSVDTTKTTGTTAPSYYTNYLTDIAKAGQTAVGMPANNMVSPLTAMQTQGYAAVPGAATAYQPQLGAAEATAGDVAAGITPDKINQFMNPYTHNVVDEMARLQQQNIQRNVMPQMKAGFVGSGGLGGQRYANATGQTMADMQSNLTGQQYGALSSGYQSAVQNALNEGQMQNQAGQLQSQLAGQEQNLGLTGAGAMTKAGAEQQAYNQAIIDAPLKQATNAAALMRGYQIPTSATETFHGPIAGTYGLSPLSQVTGLGALIGSGMSGTTNAAGATTPGWITTLGGSIYDAYNRNFGSTPQNYPSTNAGSNVNTDLANLQQQNSDMAP
jgi:hypothetical protein